MSFDFLYSCVKPDGGFFFSRNMLLFLNLLRIYVVFDRVDFGFILLLRNVGEFHLGCKRATAQK
jgi:hypothetical protein